MAPAAPPQQYSLDAREVRRDAVRIANAAARTGTRTATHVQALGHAAYEHALGPSSTRASQHLLPSGHRYTGVLAPGSTPGQGTSSSPSTGLYLATAPSLATLTAPDNMRAQKQASKDKKAKIKKRKANQAHVAASALAGRSDTSLLHPAAAGAGPSASGPSSGRASPAARSLGEEATSSRPRPTRRISSSSNLNTTVTVVASASASATAGPSSTRPVTPSTAVAARSASAESSSLTQHAAPAYAAESSTQPSRRRTTQSRASAAASELASQTEVRPYDLYREMLGEGSDEDPMLPRPSGSSRARAAPPPHVSALTQTNSSNPFTLVENAEPNPTAVLDNTPPSPPPLDDTPTYPPPPFPTGPYSTRPRTPPTPPPPLRPPDPTMNEQQQQEERELERAWEGYRARWSVPSSPPPAFVSEDEDGGPGFAPSTAGPQLRVQDNDEEEDDGIGSGSGSDDGSVSSARRAWEDDIRNGLDLPDRIARETTRRAAKSAPALGSTPGAREADEPGLVAQDSDAVVGDVYVDAGEDADAGDARPALNEAKHIVETPHVGAADHAVHSAPAESSTTVEHPSPSTEVDPLLTGPKPAATGTATASEEAQSVTQADNAAPPQAGETSVPALRGVFSVDAGAFLQRRFQGPDSGPPGTPSSSLTTTQQDQVAPPASRSDPSSQHEQTPIGGIVAPSQLPKEGGSSGGLRRLPTVNAKRLAALERRTQTQTQAQVGVLPGGTSEEVQLGGQALKEEEEGSKRTTSRSKAAARTISSSPSTAPSTATSTSTSSQTNKVSKPRIQEKYHRDALAAAERRRQLWQGTGTTSNGNDATSSPAAVVPVPTTTLVLPKAPRTSIESHYPKRNLSGGEGGGTTGAVDTDGIRPLSRSSELESHEQGELEVEDAAHSDSSEEQWQAEEQEFERLRSKEDALLRMRDRAELGDDSSDEEQEVRDAYKRSPTQRQLESLAQLDKMVPRAPPPLALGRSRSAGIAFSSSDESSDEERRLESTGSEPDDEEEEEEEGEGREVDSSALAAFNYLRARTMQLTGFSPDDESVAPSPSPTSAPGPGRRLPAVPPPPQQQRAGSPTKAHFVQNEDDDNLIAAHVFSQFSSAQKGKSPVRPVDHLLFAGAGVRKEEVSPGVGAVRPLPVPPPRVGQPVYSVSRPASLHPALPPPRPSDSPFGPQGGMGIDRSSVGTRLKGLFGTRLEGAGAGVEVLQAETVGKVRELFDRPLAGQGQGHEGSGGEERAYPPPPRPSVEPANLRWSLPPPLPVRAPTSTVSPHPQLARLATSPITSSPFAPPSPAAAPAPAPVPVPAVVRMEDVREKEAQMNAISIARSDSLRALEARLALGATDPQKASTVSSSSPLTASPSSSNQQRPFSEDRVLHTANSGPGLSRSGAITGRSGPPPAAFFTRRFGPRPASFVNPRSGEAPRPLGRLPTITPATRHYEPTKRVVPPSSEASESGRTSEAGSAVGSAVSVPPAPATGTPSLLAYIPREERTQLQDPIVPTRLHAETGVSTTSFDTPASAAAAAAATAVEVSPVQERCHSAAVDEVRMNALQRRPPPPPPPAMRESIASGDENRSADGISAVVNARRAILGRSAPPPSRAIATPPPQSVGLPPTPTPTPTRSATRPLPAIPPQVVRAESRTRTDSENSHPGTAETVPAGATTEPVEEPELQGEALLQRARSGLRPHRREPSLGITDLDLLVSQLEENGDHYENLSAISEFLGPARSTKPSAQELANLSLGKVELERRRVDASGRVKQKLSVAGVRVDRCGICLAQFREGEECCIYPCWHVYHRVCASKVLLNSRLCPSCRKDIAIES
ncbi:hypothetical protein CF335_g4188 [Tilletia laevis]|nr:hypothetical protein CF335_g4188 [Tilletia laevis]